ncbi:MAG: hypothetical protein RIQ54_308 [Candidatus Parcubacteria bacterium]|jgi:hypothetical protein
MEQNSKTSIEKSVIAAIKSGAVSMRPRWYFVLVGVLYAVATVTVLLVSAYTTGLVLFVLQQTGVFFASEFGTRGFFIFARSLPWVLVLLLLIFLVTLEVLVRRYAFSKQKPVLYTAVGIFLTVAVIGIMTAPIHQKIFLMVKQDKLGITGGMYRRFIEGKDNEVRKGVVVSMTPDGFIIEHASGATSSVTITKQTVLFPVREIIEVGNSVAVFGQEQRGCIDAYGIRKIREKE